MYIYIYIFIYIYIYIYIFIPTITPSIYIRYNCIQYIPNNKQYITL